MRSVAVIILIDLITLAHAKELVKKHNTDVEDFIDNFVNKVYDHVPSLWPFHQPDLDAKRKKTRNHDASDPIHSLSNLLEMTSSSKRPVQRSTKRLRPRDSKRKSAAGAKATKTTRGRRVSLRAAKTAKAAKPNPKTSTKRSLFDDSKKKIAGAPSSIIAGAEEATAAGAVAHEALEIDGKVQATPDLISSPVMTPPMWRVSDHFGRNRLPDPDPDPHPMWRPASAETFEDNKKNILFDSSPSRIIRAEAGGGAEAAAKRAKVVATPGMITPPKMTPPMWRSASAKTFEDNKEHIMSYTSPSRIIRAEAAAAAGAASKQAQVVATPGLITPPRMTPPKWMNFKDSKENILSYASPSRIIRAEAAAAAIAGVATEAAATGAKQIASPGLVTPKKSPAGLTTPRKSPGSFTTPRKSPAKSPAGLMTPRLENIVSYSSRMIAASRALESKRPDALVVDPLAYVFAGKAIADSPVKRMTSRIAIRTKYFDDIVTSFLNDAAEVAGSVQVVHLGAGMDSRPFRLDAPANTIYYELDKADVLTVKEELLRRAVASETPRKKNMIIKGNDHRRTVACNVELDGGTGWREPLLQAGFDPNKPTCWVLEGLTYYIRDEATMCGIFSTMRQLSAPGSRVIVSVVSIASLRVASASTKKPLAQAWKWGTDHPDHILTTCGWNCSPVDVVAPGDERANYGRFQRSTKYDLKKENGKRGVMYVTASC